MQNWMGGCLCDNWKPSFLPRFIFNWRAFLKRVRDVDEVSAQKINCGQIGTREIGGVRLQEELYAKH